MSIQRVLWLAAFPALLALLPATAAAAYKCTENGRVVFQAVPCAGGGGEAVGGTVTWQFNARGYEDAYEQAQQAGKPLLVLFYEGDCEPCGIIGNPGVQVALRRFVRVQVDAVAGPRERALVGNQYDLPYAQVQGTRGGMEGSSDSFRFSVHRLEDKPAEVAAEFARWLRRFDDYGPPP